MVELAEQAAVVDEKGLAKAAAMLAAAAVALVSRFNFPSLVVFH